MTKLISGCRSSKGQLSDSHRNCLSHVTLAIGNLKEGADAINS